MANSGQDKSSIEVLSLDQTSSPGPVTTDGLSEAKDYVDSIMSSQRVSKVNTPLEGGRKRHLSVSGTSDTTPKKARNGRSDSGNSGDESDRKEKAPSSKAARRKLYRKDAQKFHVTDAEVHVSAQPSVEEMIKKMSTDMNMMFLALNEKFEKMESGLEQRISNKVAQLLDKRVNSELKKMKSDVDTKIDDFKESIRADLAADLDDIREELRTVRPSADSITSRTKDLSQNVVIRNLPESHNENVKNKVNALFRDGLRLTDISVKDAERKQSHNSSKPGVVIATLKTVQDKQNVKKEKSKLKDSRRFSKVFIHHDQVPSQRNMSSNFRAILRAMRTNTSNLSMKGSRIVYDEQVTDRNDTRPSPSYSRDNRHDNRRNDSRRSDRRDDHQTGYNRRRDADHGRRGDRSGSRSGNRDNYRYRD